jgi:hypothetical protein
MRIHGFGPGFGERVVPVTDINYEIPARHPGGWLRAPVKNAFNDLPIEL